MSATVNMTGLALGTRYALLRWDVSYLTIGSVPWTNLLQAASPTNFEYQFIASSRMAVHNVTFMSDGISFFRVVPVR
jgi:hypothetical protein